MDTEKQIRLNFIDEAEEYFEEIESHVLGLASNIIEPQKIDIVLRCAHSIKGGSAMMGFTILSKIAHRLEDFLKVLRVSYISCEIPTEVETLLLETIDCLRVLGDFNRQKMMGSNSVVLDDDTPSKAEDRAQRIFEQLKEYLGELEAGDEDVLMAQNEGIDPALLIFEEGVETVLDEFETKLHQLEEAELSEQLALMVQELIAFGKMANLEPFVQLCQSIYKEAAPLSSEQIKVLANRALKAWRYSHALVVRGSIEKLPSFLKGNTLSESIPSPIEGEIIEDTEDILDLSDLQSAFNSDTSQMQDENLIEAELDFSEDDISNRGELQLVEEVLPVISSEVDESSSISTPQKTPSVERMAKVPAAQLKQFNNLFEQLILDRNAINLRLKQLQEIVLLIAQRINQMEDSNTELKQWYDSASVMGLFLQSWSNESSITPQDSFAQNFTNNKDRKSSSESQLLREGFDPLEMDCYGDIHLICQEQMETIVQLQEVATDLELETQEISQAINKLNYTTKFMQGNVTQTQMLPLAEIIKRFPRVIRDLNMKFNKQVELKVIGENTLLDRTFVKPLGDSLIHLLRNSFDHGIEDRETRVSQGKNPSGTITIQASNQGTYTLITFTDDGCGISVDKICDRLNHMGIPPSQVRQISETELFDFIFEPGFSTATEVTELSGRGVGMDIVRNNIEKIQGDIQVKTEQGKGTTFTLKIPFTLSILRVAVIEQAGIIFAIPADSIRELIPSLESEFTTVTENTKYIDWHGKKIPLLEIEKTFVYRRPHNNINLTGNPTINQNMALVVSNRDSFTALKISRFWQEQEYTIRPIESPIPLPTGIISSMIFGDGKVIPLIDPNLLIEKLLNNLDSNNQDNPYFREFPSINTTKNILIVDDSINIRRYLSLTLEKAGYQVEQAKDGQEALDKLLNGLSVQGIICDIEMPRLDGYSLLEEIKIRPELANIPITMLTSRSNEKHRKLALNLGASAYFSKPYNEQELLDKLAEIIQ